MTDQPRSRRCKPSLDAELLRIDRKTLSNVLATHGEVLAAVLRFVRDRLVDRWTRTSPLFRPFDDAQRAELAARFKFLEIERARRCSPAASAPMASTSCSPDRSTSSAAAHGRDVGPGELIGETALLSGDAVQERRHRDAARASRCACPRPTSAS